MQQSWPSFLQNREIREAVRAAKEQALQGTVEEHHITTSSEYMLEEDGILLLRQRITLLEQERLQLRQEVEYHKQKESEEPVLPAHVQQHIHKRGKWEGNTSRLPLRIVVSRCF